MLDKGLTRSSDVQQVQLAGVIGCLPLCRVQDQPVLARRREDVLRQVRVHTLILVGGIPKAVDHPLQSIQASRLEQRVMKEPVEVQVSSRVIRTGTRFALSQILAKVQ